MPGGADSERWEFDESPTVLIVEDEPDLLNLYASWLADFYDVKKAASGQAALEVLDDPVGVILLDRKMPDLSGDAVLSKVRDRGLDCRVAMVTAIEPDIDIIDLGFDDYLTKPVTKEELRTTVRRLLSRRQYNARLQEYFALVSKRATLISSENVDTDASEYTGIEERIAVLERELEATLTTFDNEDFRAVVRDFSEVPPGMETVNEDRPAADQA